MLAAVLAFYVVISAASFWKRVLYFALATIVLCVVFLTLDIGNRCSDIW